MSEHQKLSALMRQGAALHPQGYGAYRERIGDKLCTCAIGATLEAAGSWEYDGPFTVLYRALGHGIAGEFVHASYDDEKGIDLFGIIINLNDDAKWTREEIADWLESIGY